MDIPGLSGTDVSTTQSFLSTTWASVSAFLQGMGVVKGSVIVLVIYIIARNALSLARGLVGFFMAFMLFAWIAANQTAIVAWCTQIAGSISGWLWTIQAAVTK